MTLRNRKITTSEKTICMENEGSTYWIRERIKPFTPIPQKEFTHTTLQCNNKVESVSNFVGSIIGSAARHHGFTLVSKAICPNAAIALKMLLLLSPILAEAIIKEGIPEGGIDLCLKEKHCEQGFVEYSEQAPPVQIANMIIRETHSRPYGEEPTEFSPKEIACEYPLEKVLELVQGVLKTNNTGAPAPLLVSNKDLPYWKIDTEITNLPNATHELCEEKITRLLKTAIERYEGPKNCLHSSDGENKDGIIVGATVGGVIGGSLAAACLFNLIYWCCKKSRNANNHTNTAANNPDLERPKIGG